MEAAVHLIDLDEGGDERILSYDEHARAAGISHPIGRQRWIASRCGLRATLGEHLGLEPGSLRFDVEVDGRPVLASDISQVWFSVSHSGHWGAVAVRAGGPVGVDIQEHRSGPDVLALARRYFTTTEHAALLALAPRQRRGAFFELWVGKEAVVKCEGRGIAGMPLSSFDLGDDRWSLSSVDVAAGWSGALAVPAG